MLALLTSLQAALNMALTCISYIWVDDKAASPEPSIGWLREVQNSRVDLYSLASGLLRKVFKFLIKV